MSFAGECLLVTRRELKALLVSPLFYVLCGIFFLISAFGYLTLLVGFAQATFDEESQMNANITQGVIRQTLFVVHFFLMAQVPLLTMRSFAEDRASGALDLLQTTPLSDWALLVGKFAGTYVALAIYIATTIAFPIATSLVSRPEWPVVGSAFCVLLLAAALYSAIGLFCSSLTESQVVAAVLSYVTIFFLVLSSTLADVAGMSALGDAARHFSVSEHVDAFLRGSIGAHNIAYFVLGTALFLFLAARVLEARRWRA